MFISEGRKMKKERRIAVLIVVMILAICVLASACGGGSSSSGANSNTSVASEQTKEEAPAETENEEQTPEPEKEEKVEELIVVDNEYCTMKITGVDPDDFFGFALKVYLENKTDVPLMFSVDNCSVNGFMMDPFWAEEVAAGKKSNGSISWFSSDFEENGIEKVEEIEMEIRIYNSEDWSAEDYANLVYTVYLE